MENKCIHRWGHRRGYQTGLYCHGCGVSRDEWLLSQPTFNEVWENGRDANFISMEPAKLVDANELREEYLYEEPHGWVATKRINGLYDSRYVGKDF